jgi:signal transduction histidine kinase
MIQVAIVTAAALAVSLGTLAFPRRARRARRDAALGERHRLARDLHDGLAQELAFIVMQARRAAAQDQPRREQLEALSRSAERALDESRTLIGDLSSHEGRSVDVAVAQAAEELAHRTGASVRVAACDGVVLPPATRDALVRIVREGVTNAVRHARASEISIELTGEHGIRLRIADNGIGFDPAAAVRHGFGLTSMRERARAAGGDLEYFSEPGAGTQIEVVLP